MKKLILLSILLVVGCEEPVIEGCMTDTACNYNVDATKDDGSCITPQGCNNWCEGDSLGVQELDCAEVCGGEAESRLMGDIDGDGYFTGFCCEQASCQNNPVIYIDSEGNEACEGGSVGDAGLLMEIASSLGVGGCGNNIDFITPENCPQFYWFDINGDGHIDTIDMSCINAYATGQVPTVDGNWYTCVVSDPSNPCYGKHIGEECCISN